MSEASTPAVAPSLINPPVTPTVPTPTEVTPSAAPATPATFTPDPTKSEAENAAAKATFDKAAADAKAAEDSAKANDTKLNPFKPEEIKLPEGMSVDPALSKSFSDIINSSGVPRDVAQKLVDLQVQSMKAISEEGTRAWTETQENWRKEITADPMFAGENLTKHTTAISRLLDTHGSPEVRQAFDITGAGNNPAIVKFLAKVASTFTEGTLVQSNTPTGQATPLENRLYPSMNK